MALDASDGDDVDPATMQWEDGLEVETLINVRIAKADPRMFEMPRFERSRIHGNSNFIGSSDGLRVHRSIQIEHEGSPRNGLRCSTVVTSANLIENAQSLRR
jgi:hypothetical protein